MLLASAQEGIVFFHEGSRSAIPISSIERMSVNQYRQIDISLEGQGRRVGISADSAHFHSLLPDTLVIEYIGDNVRTANPHLSFIQVESNGADVSVSALGKRPLVCVAKGHSSNGRLIIDCDTTCTLVLNDLQLTSRRGSAICFTQKQKVELVLAYNTTNTLADVEDYADETTNACLYAKGSIDISGRGTLNVVGNYKHAIASGKNITVEGGNIHITDAVKDGVRCDKLKMKGGTIDIHLTHPASKGIKAKESIHITGGIITGNALGDVSIEDGGVSYCALLKSDGTFQMTGGSLQLRNNGISGRCISVDSSVTIKGGTLQLETHGDGGSYLTTAGEQDYYTPKCITADGSIRIERGRIECLATGAGGKGIDCSDTLFIGRKGDGFISEDSLLISIETRGSALVDNVEEDYRRGCPKAIKSDVDINIFSGTLRLMTHGQGGEGIEANASLRAYNATIIADCFDDGINTGQRCYIDGAHVFCRSINNDGIDSNGKMSVVDGIVAAISEHEQNESFDTQGGRLYIYGGHIVGIGRNAVEISELATTPNYSTSLTVTPWGQRNGDGIMLKANQYMSICRGSDAIITMRHEAAFSDAFVTVASTLFQNGESLTISDGERPEDVDVEWLDGRIIVGGKVRHTEYLLNFTP